MNDKVKALNAAEKMVGGNGMNIYTDNDTQTLQCTLYLFS